LVSFAFIAFPAGERLGGTAPASIANGLIASYGLVGDFACRYGVALSQLPLGEVDHVACVRHIDDLIVLGWSVGVQLVVLIPALTFAGRGESFKF